MVRSLIFLLGIFLLALTCLFFWPLQSPHPEHAAAHRALDVGLNQAQTLAFHHTHQGTNLFPLAFLAALKDQKSGKSSLEILSHYGFLPGNQGKGNPYGLPVGLAADTQDFLGHETPVVGLNCSACHSGALHFQGREYRIDGAPNLIDVEGWAVDTAANAAHLLHHPGEALSFLARFLSFDPAGEALPLSHFYGLEDQTIADLHLAAQHLDQGATQGDPHPDDDVNHIAETFQRLHSEIAKGTPAAIRSATPASHLGTGKTHHSLRALLAEVKARAQVASRTITALQNSPEPGPGRDDAWNLVNLIVLQENTTLDAPIGVPPLFNVSEYEWVHADGNTNSVLQRNIAQGVALGADVALDGVTTSLLPRAINHLDKLILEITAPAWPADFPSLDEQKITEGKVIFNQHPILLSDGKTYHCSTCHEEKAGTRFDLDLIKTSRARWAIYNEPLPAGPEKLKALQDRVDQIMVATMSARGISRDTYQAWETSADPEWVSTKGYTARHLAGIWASPPYLHNNSVRTLYELFLPEEQRATSFQVGTRNFDPVQVGFEDASGARPYTLDTTRPFNNQLGHDFTRDLTEAQRFALIEYLKSL